LKFVDYKTRGGPANRKFEKEWKLLSTKKTTKVISKDKRFYLGLGLALLGLLDLNALLWMKGA